MKASMAAAYAICVLLAGGMHQVHAGRQLLQPLTGATATPTWAPSSQQPTKHTIVRPNPELTNWQPEGEPFSIQSYNGATAINPKVIPAGNIPLPAPAPVSNLRLAGPPVPVAENNNGASGVSTANLTPATMIGRPVPTADDAKSSSSGRYTARPAAANMAAAATAAPLSLGSPIATSPISSSMSSSSSPVMLPSASSAALPASNGVNNARMAAGFASSTQVSSTQPPAVAQPVTAGPAASAPMSATPTLKAMPNIAPTVPYIPPPGTPQPPVGTSAANYAARQGQQGSGPNRAQSGEYRGATIAVPSNQAMIAVPANHQTIAAQQPGLPFGQPFGQPGVLPQLPQPSFPQLPSLAGSSSNSGGVIGAPANGGTFGRPAGIPGLPGLPGSSGSSDAAQLLEAVEEAVEGAVQGVDKLVSQVSKSLPNILSATGNALKNLPGNVTLPSPEDLVKMLQNGSVPVPPELANLLNNTAGANLLKGLPALPPLGAPLPSLSLPTLTTLAAGATTGELQLPKLPSLNIPQPPGLPQLTIPQMPQMPQMPSLQDISNGAPLPKLELPKLPSLDRPQAPSSFPGSSSPVTGAVYDEDDEFMPAAARAAALRARSSGSSSSGASSSGSGGSSRSGSLSSSSGSSSKVSSSGSSQAPASRPSSSGGSRASSGSSGSSSSATSTAPTGSGRSHSPFEPRSRRNRGPARGVFRVVDGRPVLST